MLVVDGQWMLEVKRERKLRPAGGGDEALRCLNAQVWLRGGKGLRMDER